MKEFNVYWISLPNHFGRPSNGCERDILAPSALAAIQKMREIVQQRILQTGEDIKAYKIEHLSMEQLHADNYIVADSLD